MLRVLCFNSRTLGRVRRVGTQQGKDINYVSIHAPWEGCDVQRERRSRQRQQFQFTHPGKGATSAKSAYFFSGSVSIHAPWEGCDGLEPS